MVRVVGFSDLEADYDRRYASEAIGTDVRCTSIGPLLFLGLLVPVWYQLRRADLAAMLVVCALASIWPRILAARALSVYVRYRDHLMFLHTLFFAITGGILQQHLNVHRKIPARDPVAFIATFLLGSSLPWHALHATTYRMRATRYWLYRPIVMLAAFYYETPLCVQACHATPEKAHFFQLVARNLRTLFSLFLPLPLLATASSATDDPLVSCIKMQAFLLGLVGLFLPGFFLFGREKQMRHKFVRELGALVIPDEEAAAYAALEQEIVAAESARLTAAGPASASEAAGPAARHPGAAASTSVPSAAAPRTLCMLRQRRDEQLAAFEERWQAQQVRGEELHEAAAADGCAKGEVWLWRLSSRWQQGVAPVILVALSWHLVDVLL